MRTKVFSIPVIAGLVLLAAVSHDLSASEPLYVKNLSPVTGLIGLPSQRVADTQSSGTLGVALHGSIASHYVAEFNALEGLNLDGETPRVALELRYGLAEDWDLQLEVPWLGHSGGHLDSIIDSWHSLWGGSDGGRSDVPRDILDYRYGGPDTRFALLDDTSGLGDITLSLSRQIYRDEDAAASLALGYKFATGDEDDFLGSGGDDVFLALRFSGDHLSSFPLSWHGQVGYLRAGDSPVLNAAQERDLWFGGLAMDWSVAQAWSVIVQLDVHAAVADSDLAALGDEAVMLSLGGRWRFARQWSLDLNFIEDVRVQTAPDITFQASLRYFGDVAD